MHALAQSTPMPAARIAAIYLAEARCECLRYLRTPSFMLPLLLFPAVFYLMFGVAFAQASGGPRMARYLIASYGTFGVMVPGLFGFGVSLALERGSGLLMLKRALPMPPAAYLIGKLVMAIAAAALVVVILLGLGVFVAGVEIAPAVALALVVTGALGAIPFCAFGMLIGTLIRGEGAPGFINLVYLPMAFLSGLWFPLEMLPEGLQKIAPIWPSWHLHRIALDVLGMASESIGTHVLVLAVFSAACLFVAARRLARLG